MIKKVPDTIARLKDNEKKDSMFTINRIGRKSFGITIPTGWVVEESLNVDFYAYKPYFLAVSVKVRTREIPYTLDDVHKLKLEQLKANFPDLKIYKDDKVVFANREAMRIVQYGTFNGETSNGIIYVFPDGNKYYTVICTANIGFDNSKFLTNNQISTCESMLKDFRVE